MQEKKITRPYVVVDDVAGLISLAQIGALEIHAWGSPPISWNCRTD